MRHHVLLTDWTNFSDVLVRPTGIVPAMVQYQQLVIIREEISPVQPQSAHVIESHIWNVLQNATKLGQGNILADALPGRCRTTAVFM